MGINAEFVKLVADLRSRKLLSGDSVVEIGAQDVSVAGEVVSKILADDYFKVGHEKKINASNLYLHLGFTQYTAIDASGGGGALVFDLNKDIREHYKYAESFDLVTNLGTAEHCFNQYAVFKNLHDLCKPGGLIIHALTAQGNVNHGFYNYHPRFVADLSVANNYEIMDLSFTVDYKPDLIKYTKASFQKWDSHDLLIYAVLRKKTNSPFCIPFDGMFSSANQLDDYAGTGLDPLVTEFSPYLKGGDWDNTRGIKNNKAPQVYNRLKVFLRRLFSGLS